MLSSVTVLNFSKNRIPAITDLQPKTFRHLEKFLIPPCILGEEDPKDRSNFGLKIDFVFHFFPKIWSGMLEIEASQGFWYQEVSIDNLFQN